MSENSKRSLILTLVFDLWSKSNRFKAKKSTGGSSKNRVCYATL